MSQIRKKTNRIKCLDKTEMAILINVSNGVESCVYLSEILRVTKGYISQRVKELEEYGLINVVRGTTEHFTRDYKTTPKAEKILNNALLEMNKEYLDTLKK